ncbi:MAG: family 78 glycoside hydrolase catalytic domain, partial [Clostridia bacterium]|nr:family 78 glycoside hydrolase catalytic domain [Clostridia bacterium]
WCDADAPVEDWAKVSISRDPGGILRANEMPSVKQDKEYPAISVKNVAKNTYLFDFGQNMAGFVRIKVNGPKGTTFTIKMNEKLKEDGTLDTVQNSGFTKTGEFQTDKYIKRSDEEEIWQPRFVYHGFRYAQIEGFATKPDTSAATAVFLHTAVKEIGQFSCSDEIINQIQKNTRMATYSNMYGLLTDSPHREKNAWTGDTNVSTEQMLFNYMSGPIWIKWLNDIKDSMKAKGNIPCMVPTAGWGYNWGNGPDYSSVLTWLPDHMNTYYSDKSMICKYYEYMKRNMFYMLSMMQDDVCVNDYGVGDWCAPFEGPAISVNMSSFKAPIDLTDTACMYTMANVLEKFAKMVGIREDAKEFSKIAKRIKAGFRRAFFDVLTGRLKGDGQTCYAAMLYHNLYENEKEYDLIYSHLIRTINEADGHLDYGILGNKYVNNILGKKGRADVIYSMITQDTFPSFANCIKELGATTLYECWNGEGSRNHHMFGDISATFFKYFAGIQPDPEYPGFRRFTIAPGFNTPLEKVDAVYESMLGTIRCSYVKTEKSIIVDIEVPVNSCAVFKAGSGMDIYEDNNLLGNECVELESGKYKLEVKKTA